METGPKYVNYGLGYKQNIVKSSMSNFESNEVLRLIFIQAFQVINLAF